MATEAFAINAAKICMDYGLRKLDVRVAGLSKHFGENRPAVRR